MIFHVYRSVNNLDQIHVEDEDDFPLGCIRSEIKFQYVPHAITFENVLVKILPGGYYN